MRCPPSAEPLPGRLSPQAPCRPVSAAAPARRSTWHQNPAQRGGFDRRRGSAQWQRESSALGSKTGGVPVHRALIVGCRQVSPASHDTANGQHPGDGRRAAALSCGRNVEASRSTALSKARRPGMHSERRWRSARQPGSVDVRRGVHQSVATIPGTADARHARHPYPGTRCRLWGRVAPIRVVLACSTRSRLQ